MIGHDTSIDCIIALLVISFRQWTIVHGCQKINQLELTQKFMQVGVDV